MSPTIVSPPASLPTTETAPGQGWTPVQTRGLWDLPRSVLSHRCGRPGTVL